MNEQMKTMRSKKERKERKGRVKDGRNSFAFDVKFLSAECKLVIKDVGGAHCLALSKMPLA